MRAEDKEVDGPELERDAERQRQSELEEQDEQELPELSSEEDRSTEHRATVIAAMRLIMRKEHVPVSQLQLPQRELRALEALRAAVEGKDAERDQFVYATDRRDLLEQALAILQPNFVTGDAQHAQLLGSYGDLIEQVGELRHGLLELTDAQDELLHGNEAAEVTKADGDTDDKPDPKPDDTSLTGPERTLPPKPASSLTGPERAQAPKPASSLMGPEVAEAAKPASSLGDPTELAAAAPVPSEKKKPWWRRPFGG